MPRKHYIYKTIREQRLRLDKPRPYRESKYLIHSGLPRVSLISFDLKAVASLVKVSSLNPLTPVMSQPLTLILPSLVQAMAMAGHRDEACLQAVERFVTASLRRGPGKNDSGPKSTPATGAAESPASALALASPATAPEFVSAPLLAPATPPPEDKQTEGSTSTSQPVQDFMDGQTGGFISEANIESPLDRDVAVAPAPFKSSFDFTSSTIAPVLGGFSPPPLEVGT